MELQRLIIQRPLESGSRLDLNELIPVFHRWIQQQLIKDHLLIDVGDYLHLKRDPKLLLVAHEGTFSVIYSPEGLVLQYQRRRPISGMFTQRLEKIWNTLQLASRLLEQETALEGKIHFEANRFRIIVNELLWTETTENAPKVLEETIREAFRKEAGMSGFTVTCSMPDTKERLLLEFEVTSIQDLDSTISSVEQICA